jgi:hypothetical protein
MSLFVIFSEHSAAHFIAMHCIIFCSRVMSEVEEARHEQMMLKEE